MMRATHEAQSSCRLIFSLVLFASSPQNNTQFTQLGPCVLEGNGTEEMDEETDAGARDVLADFTRQKKLLQQFTQLAIHQYGSSATVRSVPFIPASADWQAG